MSVGAISASSSAAGVASLRARGVTSIWILPADATWIGSCFGCLARERPAQHGLVYARRIEQRGVDIAQRQLGEGAIGAVAVIGVG